MILVAIQLIFQYIFIFLPPSYSCDGPTCFVYSAPPNSLMENRRLEGYLIRNISAPLVTCLDECAMDCRCMSFNLINETLCQLNYADNETAPLVSDTRSSYHNIQITSLSTSIHSHCDDLCCPDFPCENGGICVEICTHPRKRFNCTCQPGYTGRLCEVNIDDCASNPCGKWGYCIDGINQFSCRCFDGFTGPFCQNATSTSCTDLKARGNTMSQEYLIDPDGGSGEPAFTVYCDMTDKNGIGVTEISHDSEDRTLVDDPSCSSKGCYSCPVTYTDATMAQIVQLISVSSHCEQFIKYECLGSGLLYEWYGWWVSRGNQKMKYWGGATRNSGMCACGMNGSCEGGSTRPCNCDTPDDKWHEDSGYLSYSEDLPVTELRFGDVERDDEKGYHTLGKLRCYGKK